MIWDANLYLKFADHRVRPALDLMGRLDPANGNRPGHAISAAAPATSRASWPNAFPRRR